MSHAIGIDLGTTYSCVAHFANNRVEIIANDQGNRTTPSFVAFTDSEQLVGDTTINQAARNPENTLFDAKRLIGRNFMDPDIQKDLRHYPFKVINKAGKPVFEVKHKGETKVVTPEEISSMILVKMKETAELYLGAEVKDAVITVPAYFNNAQRRATRDAAVTAGLNVLRIINEPTAAAIAYGLHTPQDKKQCVLVFDLGGGTFDISLLYIAGDLMQVIATAGNTHLGGEDFDNVIVDYIAAEFKRTHKRDLTSSPKALRRLRAACERAKRALSSCSRTTIEVDSLYQGIDFHISITRVRFEELCMDLFRSCLVPLEKVLKDANIKKSQVDEIIMVGGSTRIPKIRSLVSDYFDGKSLNHGINPDEAVAYGAAVQASILAGGTTPKTVDLRLLDVTPLSLGVRIFGGIMRTIIPRNSTLPIKMSRGFETSFDNQTRVRFPLFEGERKLTKYNNLLGELALEGITPAPRGATEIEVTLEVDVNGILSASAREKGAKNSKSITVTTDSSSHLDHEIERMVCEADKHEAEDEVEVERTEASKTFTYRVEDFDSYAWERGALEDEFRAKLGTEGVVKLKTVIAEATKWLKNSRNASEQEFQAKQKEFERTTASITAGVPLPSRLSLGSNQEPSPKRQRQVKRENPDIGKPVVI